MTRRAWGLIAGGALLFQGGIAVAQSSLQTLQQELNDARQKHEQVTEQVLTNFFNKVDPAMGSPDAAIALYAQARSAPKDSSPPRTDPITDLGSEPGSEPSLRETLLSCGIPPTPVVTQHTNETETERETRLAVDQANLSKLGIALQLHCGLLHYAALFVAKPDQKGLQEDWVAWLNSAAQIYPQLAVAQDNGDQNPDPGKKRGDAGDGAPGTKPAATFYPAEMKEKTMRDSVISKFLGFDIWSDKEQGAWAVKDLPKLYRTDVLDPARATPTAATLAAWDAYIAMASADERDTNKWYQVDYPPLHFERACDDYAVAPGTEKLEALVNLIKENPTNPQADDWISRVGKLLGDYRASHGGGTATPHAPAPAPPAPNANPNVTITTEQQGDATIITTHTNSAPVNPLH
jgi:hypothetical protein